MAKTKAMENRAIRQEALRDQLCNQGHVQHIIEICEQLNKLKDEMSLYRRDDAIINRLVSCRYPSLERSLTGSDVEPNHGEWLHSFILILVKSLY